MKNSLILAVVMLLLGCTDSAELPVLEEPAQTAADAISGAVSEVIDVDNYIYIQIRTDNDSFWIAANPIAVQFGDSIIASGAMEMENFHSTKLDRTFDKILFVDSIAISEVSARTPSAPPAMAALPSGHPEILGKKSNLIPAALEIQPLDGGMTVAEIYSAYPDIAGQAVSLRASALKFSSGIMGSNWVTLQDGSGTAPNNVLVVKTADTVDIGETVTVSGTARINVSLGYGYDYKILLEEASFTR